MTDNAPPPILTIIPTATGSLTIIKASPYTPPNAASIPRRQWLYRPNYIREFVSATFSTGGIGKSSQVIVEMLAMASGKALLGVLPEKQLKVWYWNGEDPKDELDRRIVAAMKHHGLDNEQVGDRLFVDSGRVMPIVIAEDTRIGTRVYEPVVDQVVATLLENRIDVLIVDPFVSCHRVSENDNPAIERVVKAWAHIAELAHCSIMLVHHTRKTNGEAVTVDDGRGASALAAAVRSARVLNNMTKSEAELAEIDPSKRRFYFRADNGKANMTPPAEKADWFYLVSVELGNGPELGQDVAQFSDSLGDNVGVVVRWQFPTVAPPTVANEWFWNRGPDRQTNGNLTVDQNQRVKRGPDGRFQPGNKEARGRIKGSQNKITKSIRERVLEGFHDPNSKGDGIVEFVNELKKDFPPAAAGLLARMMPSGDAPDETGGVIYGDIIINAIPTGHSKCPDDNIRPTSEAAKLWEEHKARGLPDPTANLKVEPEIALLIEAATKGKRDDDPQAG